MGRLSLNGQQRFGARHQAGTENRVSQVGSRFLEAPDGVFPGHRAEPQAIQLGKDIPHPVRALPAPLEFGQGRGVIALLRFEKAIQIVRIGCHGLISGLSGEPPGKVVR